MEKFNCIVVDDDEVAGLRVVSVARSFPVLNILKVFTSSEKALAFIEKENGDLVNVFSSGNFNPDGKIEFTSVDYNKETFYNFTNWIKSL